LSLGGYHLEKEIIKLHSANEGRFGGGGFENKNDVDVTSGVSLWSQGTGI
jgi:hypothetical protein